MKINVCTRMFCELFIMHYKLGCNSITAYHLLVQGINTNVILKRSSLKITVTHWEHVKLHVTHQWKMYEISHITFDRHVYMLYGTKKRSQLV